MKTIAAAAAAATVLLAACASNGGALAPPVAAGAARDAVRTIYSNLGPAKKVYDCCIAWTIGGPKSKIGYQRIAAPFRPAAAATALQVRIALTWSVGPNASLRLVLAADASGFPGKPLATAVIPGGVPAFETCCTLQSVALPHGVALKKGAPYWIVVETAARSAKTVDNWQNNTTGAGGNVSGDTGAGWKNTYVTKGLPAFAVTGS